MSKLIIALMFLIPSLHDNEVYVGYDLVMPCKNIDAVILSLRLDHRKGISCEEMVGRIVGKIKSGEMFCYPHSGRQNYWIVNCSKKHKGHKVYKIIVPIKNK